MGSQIKIPIRLSLTSWKNAFDASQEAVRGNRQKNPPLSLVEDQGQSSMSFGMLVCWSSGRVFRCASISFAEIGYIQRERDSCSSVVTQLCNPNYCPRQRVGGLGRKNPLRLGTLFNQKVEIHLSNGQWKNALWHFRNRVGC
jgi:hypothetical protein